MVRGSEGRCEDEWSTLKAAGTTTEATVAERLPHTSRVWAAPLRWTFSSSSSALANLIVGASPVSMWEAELYTAGGGVCRLHKPKHGKNESLRSSSRVNHSLRSRHLFAAQFRPRTPR